MGLGRFIDVPLAAARKSRNKWAAEILAGNDPISTRQKKVAAAWAEADRQDPMFEEMAEVVFEARKSRLRGGGINGRWMSPLTVHVGLGGGLMMLLVLVTLGLAIAALIKYLRK